MFRLHSSTMLQECDTVSCELCKRYALLQCPRSRIQRMLHTRHQACRRWQCWGIFYWYVEDALNGWGVSWTIYGNEPWTRSGSVWGFGACRRHRFCRRNFFFFLPGWVPWWFNWHLLDQTWQNPSKGMLSGQFEPTQRLNMNLQIESIDSFLS